MYLIVLGTLLNLSLLGWALGAFDGGGGDDDGGSGGDDIPDIGDDTIEIGGDDTLGEDTLGDDTLTGDAGPDTPSTPGTAEETTSGPDGEDTIGGEDTTGGDDTTGTGDTITAGADTVLGTGGDTIAGGAGADTFYLVDSDDEGLVIPGVNGVTITDFEPGVDRILVTSHPEAAEQSPERQDVFDWDLREDGVALMRDAEGADPVEVVFLAGLDAAPPDSDVAVQTFLDRTVDDTLSTDDLDDFFDNPANFVQRVTGADTGDLLEFDTASTPADLVLEAQTNGGGDIVQFHGFRSDVDLGAGDDVYGGRSDVLTGEEYAREAVAGGAGNDTIRVGTSIVDVSGGDGDDFLAGNDVIGGVIDGGAGDDELSVSLLQDGDGIGGPATVILIGGEGSDQFTVQTQDALGDERVAVIADFDETEDTLIVTIPSDSLEDWEVSLAPAATGGTQVMVDGIPLVTVATGLTNLSAVSVVSVSPS